MILKAPRVVSSVRVDLVATFTHLKYRCGIQTQPTCMRFDRVVLGPHPSRAIYGLNHGLKKRAKLSFGHAPKGKT